MPAAPRPRKPAGLTAFLAAYPPSVRRLALRARELIHARHPGLCEKVWPGWKGIGLGTSPRMSDMVVVLSPARAHLGINLVGGVDLPDPEGLLEGTGKSSRHVKVTSLAALEAPAVQALIDDAFRLAAVRAAPPPQGAPAKKPARAPATAKAPVTASAGVVPGWTPPVSDTAVAEKTGRTWAEWIAALDSAGCATMSHAAIAKVAGAQLGAGPWWQQMVAVGYERARGLRQVHQTTQGYQVGASRTVGVDLATLWRAWHDAALRRRWLPADFTVRKATTERSMRITWNDGSDVQVLFYARGPEKSQVTIDNRKLPDDVVEERKAYWKARLAALEAVLGTTRE